MRYIVLDEEGRLLREQPPEGEARAQYWVDEKGSWALVRGVLYHDGRPVPPGEYELPTPQGTVRITVAEVADGGDGGHGDSDS